MPYVSVAEDISAELLDLFAGDGERSVAVMQAFMDESGTHKGAPTISVAAWVGAGYQWKKFLSHWDNKYFHAKERKCNPLRQSLFEAIEFGELEGFTAWMNPQDYKAHATGLMKSGLGNPYSVCTFASAMGVCKFCKTRNLGKVAFVIEGGQPNVEFVRATLEFMRTEERFGIASVAVAGKKDFVQLCTADFLAYSRTSAPDWFETFWKTGRVSQDQLTSERVVSLSLKMEEAFKRRKREEHLRKTSDTLRNNDANAKGQTAQ